MGGGGSILLGGLNLLGGGLGHGASTAVAVISWPSICPVEKKIKSQNITPSHYCGRFGQETCIQRGSEEGTQSRGTKTPHAQQPPKEVHPSGHLSPFTDGEGLCPDLSQKVGLALSCLL